MGPAPPDPMSARSRLDPPSSRACLPHAGHKRDPSSLLFSLGAPRATFARGLLRFSLFGVRRLGAAFEIALGGTQLNLRAPHPSLHLRAKESHPSRLAASARQPHSSSTSYTSFISFSSVFPFRNHGRSTLCIYLGNVLFFAANFFVHSRASSLFPASFK